MGAQEFSVYAVAKTPQDAFRKAQREADDYYGHREGYSGQINSKHEFVVVPYEKYKGREAEKVAWELVEQNWRGLDDKWGPAGCIEIKTDKASRIKKSEGVSGKKGYKVYYLFGLAPY